KLQNMSRYHASRYVNGGKTSNKALFVDKNRSIASLVDLIRITHPRGPPGSVIEEIVKTGKINPTSKYTEIDDINEADEVCEKLIVEGKSWKYIIKTIKLPHIVLLKNLKKIIAEYSRSSVDMIKHVKKI